MAHVSSSPVVLALLEFFPPELRIEIVCGLWSHRACHASTLRIFACVHTFVFLWSCLSIHRSVRQRAFYQKYKTVTNYLQRGYVTPSPSQLQSHHSLNLTTAYRRAHMRTKIRACAYTQAQTRCRFLAYGQIALCYCDQAQYMARIPCQRRILSLCLLLRPSSLRQKCSRGRSCCACLAILAVRSILGGGRD